MYMILLGTRIACAQLYDKTWVCGGYAGKVTFNDNGTVDTARYFPFVNVLSECASVCNKEGELQFFTEGVNVYSSDGFKMPNGIQLADNEVNSDFNHGLPDFQNVLVLPKQDKEYYILYQSQSDFAFENDYWVYTDNLYYSVVDMEQQNGKGTWYRSVCW